MGFGGKGAVSGYEEFFSRKFKLLTHWPSREAGQMDSRRMKIMGFLLIGICLTGCATLHDVVQSKERGEGTSRVYPVNADQAWEIAKTVFRWERTETVEEHRSEGYMLTSSEESLISWGAMIGVWIEPVNNDSTRVTFVVRRKNPTELFISVTEAMFHDDFELAGRIKTGRFITPVPVAGKSPSAAPEQPTTSVGDVVTVTWTFANVRSGAGNDFSVIATVKQGDRLTVIGEDRDWFNVRLENGQVGWIDSKKVR